MVMAPRSDSNAAAGSPADDSLALRIEGELGQMRKALSNLIEFSGMSRREVERRLLESDCGTDLGRLLSGRLDPKMKHLLALCRVIDLEPLEFVQIALKPRPDQRSPLLRRLEALLPYARAEAGAAAPPRTTAEIAALLRRAQDLAEQLQEFMREAARIPTPADGHRQPPREVSRSRGRVAPDRVG
jgi:hypothetical protein